MIGVMVVVIMSECSKFTYGDYGFNSIGNWSCSRIVLYSFREMKCHQSYTPGYTSITLLTKRFLRFSFSANMDEDPQLAERVFSRSFSEPLKRPPPKTQTLSKRPAESSKMNKKVLILKNKIFLQNDK